MEIVTTNTVILSLSLVFSFHLTPPHDVCWSLPGQRQSLRYWYDREWLSNGHMYGLSFLRENYSHQNAKKITTTHQLLGDVHHLVEVLNGLQLKMSVLQWVKDSRMASPANMEINCNFLIICMYIFLLSHVQKQHSPWSAAVAATLEASGEVAFLLWLVLWQWRGSISCHAWRGHEPRRDPHVQRPGEAEPCGRRRHHHHLLFFLFVQQRLLALPLLPGLVHY